MPRPPPGERSVSTPEGPSRSEAGNLKKPAATVLTRYGTEFATCIPAYLPIEEESKVTLTYLPTCLPAYLLTCLSAYLPTCLPAYLPTFLFIAIFIIYIYF